MKEYAIEPAEDDVPLCGDIDDSPWSNANVAKITNHPWDTGADRQEAAVRALYDDTAMYLQYQVDDAHSTAETTTVNGPVYEDSAVEVFATPSGQPNYFNFEVNCVGTFLLGWGPNRNQRERITPSLAKSVRVETSIDTPTKSASSTDDSWWVAVALPFDTLSAFTGIDVEPKPGSTWRGNFHRLGGGSEFAVWNTIDTRDPDLHSPESFGRFEFS